MAFAGKGLHANSVTMSTTPFQYQIMFVFIIYSLSVLLEMDAGKDNDNGVWGCFNYGFSCDADGITFTRLPLYFRNIHMEAKEICEAYYAEEYLVDNEEELADEYNLPDSSTLADSSYVTSPCNSEKVAIGLNSATSLVCDTPALSHQIPKGEKVSAPPSSSLHSNLACGPSRSYADVCEDRTPDEELERLKSLPLCPYAIDCSQEYCDFLHGLPCDLCNRPILHPYDEKQRREHKEECVKEHEKQMELSFAIQRSIDKNCGICMDLVLEKEPSCERRFGILEKCNHTFCLGCIRKWRQTKQFDSRTIRSCPECRVSSDFVIPSKFWVEEKEDKDKLIAEYKKALSLKPCKYFKQGRGDCPFAGACFYLHAYPDGTKADMPPPRPRVRRHNSSSSNSDYESARNVLLWNYMETRNESLLLPSLDIEEMFEMRHFFDLVSSDSDDESGYD